MSDRIHTINTILHYNIFNIIMQVPIYNNKHNCFRLCVKCWKMQFIWCAENHSRMAPACRKLCKLL